jgi:hypothetical protein
MISSSKSTEKQNPLIAQRVLYSKDLNYFLPVFAASDSSCFN